MFTPLSKKNIMPRLAELADRVITLVTEESDIPREATLSKSRTAEVVDARHLAIKLLHLKDIYPSKIASLFNISTRCVNYAITSFDCRVSQNNVLRYSYEAIKKKLKEDQ